MRFTSVLLCMFLTGFIFGQTSSVELSFLPVYENKLLSLETAAFIAPGKTMEIETLKFFISSVEFYEDGQVVFQEKNSYHLINLEQPESLNIDLEMPEMVKFTHLKFNIGIDSITSVSGVFGGDLDPTNGMYWTWQSGYINFKLEGIAADCPARNNVFQFHIGGYQKPFETMQEVSLVCAKSLDSQSIKINVAVDEFLNQLDLSKIYQIMSPNQKSADLAKLLPSIFSIAL